MGGMTCRASLIKGKYAGEPRAEGLHGSGGHVTQSYSTVVWEVGDCTTLLNTPEFSSFPEICYQIYRSFNKMYFKQSTKITTIKTAKLSLINGSSLNKVGCSIGEGFFSEYIVVFFYVCGCFPLDDDWGGGHSLPNFTLVCLCQYCPGDWQGSHSTAVFKA